MTPDQRQAALRLADYWSADSWPGGLSGKKMDETAALLRELAEVPVRDSDNDGAKTMLADAWERGFAAGDEWRSAVVRFWSDHDSDERNEAPRQPANPHKPAPTGPVCNLRTPWLAPDELSSEPVQEPVAYGLLKPDGSIDTELVGTQADCEYWSRAENEEQSGWKVTPLYAHPPQQRKPLTDDEALAIIRATPQEDVTKEGWIHKQRLSWVRAIERAHGITGEPK